MNWYHTLEIFNRHRTNQPVIVSPGMTGAILYTIDHRQPALYNTGLSYASPYAFGLALQRPDLRVVAIEGDGSIIAGLGHLTTIARYSPRNLVVLVMDNGSYLSPSERSLPAATAYGVNLAGMARAAGIEKAIVIDDLELFDEWIHRALAEEGPFVIVCKIDGSNPDRRDLKPYSRDRIEQAVEFRQYLQEHPDK
jgi:thiamine pyrophosphate-dependent acetolactate synthase large subunit-like protein